MRARKIVISFAVLAVLAAAGVYFGTKFTRGGLPITLPLPPSPYCTAASHGTVTLEIDQMANAATIVAVGIRRGVPDRAVVVALATAFQESRLHNVNGGDRDSVGLFQQRPSQGWGTPKQISDPSYAASRFYSSLLRVRGWEKMSVTKAAQSVQRSALPDAYQQWAPAAGVLAGALLGDASAAVACVVDDTPQKTGTRALSGLSTFLRHDWGDLFHRIDTATPDALALSVADVRDGWQYAHWLVAHASDNGIKRVQYGDQQWTAKDGVWATRPVPAGTAATTVTADATGRTVVAEVFGAAG